MKTWRHKGLTPLIALLFGGWVTLIVLDSCHRHPIHPGAVSQFDSDVYDTLLTAQAALDEAKVQLQAGKLPADSKQVINDAGLVYNELREAWLAYRAAKLAGKTGTDLDLTVARINAVLPHLNQLIENLRKVTGGK